MGIEVFSIAGSPHSFDVLWKKQTTMPVCTDDDKRLCVGMTMAWLEKSIFYGAINSIAELGSLHSMAIVASAFNKVIIPGVENWNDLFLGVFDLLSVQRLSPETWIFGPDKCAPYLVTSNMSSNGGSYLIFLVGDKESGGHMMGARVQREELDFFDPNLGLYRFTDSGEFMSVVGKHIFQEYNHLMELPWLVVEVRSF